MTDQPVQPEAPTTEAGRQLVEDEPRLITGEHSMLRRVLAIEAEARAASWPDTGGALDEARKALADIMSMTVDHLDEPRMAVIHRAAQRGAELESARLSAQARDGANYDVNGGDMLIDRADRERPPIDVDLLRQAIREERYRFNVNERSDELAVAVAATYARLSRSVASPEDE